MQFRLFPPPPSAPKTAPNRHVPVWGAKPHNVSIRISPPSNPSNPSTIGCWSLLPFFYNHKSQIIKGSSISRPKTWDSKFPDVDIPLLCPCLALPPIAIRVIYVLSPFVGYRLIVKGESIKYITQREFFRSMGGCLVAARTLQRIVHCIT